jgi:hypothetical protein
VRGNLIRVLQFRPTVVFRIPIAIHKFICLIRNEINRLDERLFDGIRRGERKGYYRKHKLNECLPLFGFGHRLKYLAPRSDAMEVVAKSVEIDRDR